MSYCGVGCGLLVQVRDGRVTKVKGDPAHPASLGDLCAKAVHLPPALMTTDRLLHPQIPPRATRELERAPWEPALRFTAERMREIVDAHGPDAVAFYASGQLLTEEYYLASKLAKDSSAPTTSTRTRASAWRRPPPATRARWARTAPRPPTRTSTAPIASS